jgi:hypothetical protein
MNLDDDYEKGDSGSEMDLTELDEGSIFCDPHNQHISRMQKVWPPNSLNHVGKEISSF